MPRSSNNNSKIGLVSVRKFGVIVTFLCLFFIAGLVVGYFTFFREVKEHTCPIVNIDPDDTDIDYVTEYNPLDSRNHHLPNLDKHFNDVPDFFIKPHLLVEKSATEIRKTLELSAKVCVSMQKYDIAVPRFQRNRKSSIKFFTDGETISKELLKGSLLFNLFHGIVRARVVLIEGKSKLEELDISSMKGSIILTPIDSLSLHKIRFFEALKARAVLLYKENFPLICPSNTSLIDEKPYWWNIDPSTPGYVAIDEIFKLPPQKWNIPKIPVINVPCQVILDIQPYLEYNKDLEGEFEVFSNLVNIVASNLIISIPGLKEPDLSIMVGAKRSNMFGSMRLMRMLRSLSSLINTGWTPHFTLTFVSWDSTGYGVSEFIEGYKSISKERIMMYIDLNQYVADNGIDHLMTSLSLENFVKTILEQASINMNIRRAKNSEIQATEHSTGLIMEQELGIPFIKCFSSHQDDDEAEVLRMFGAVTMAAVTTNTIQISLQKTVGEISRTMKNFMQVYPAVREHISAMPQLIHKFRTLFDDSLKSGPPPIRMTNMLKVNIETTLRKSIHRLKCLIDNPLSKFLQTNNSHIAGDVYLKLFRNFFENDSMNKCVDNSFLTCITYEMSVVMSRLYNILQILR